MTHYLVFGIGFYIGAAIKDPQGFSDADAASLIRGLIIGILFWPIGLIIQLICVMRDYK
jgi:hypothetical protein